MQAGEPTAGGGVKTAEEELFLIRLRFREGRLIDSGANKPFLLDDPETMWVVYSGKVDIFLTTQRDGAAAGPRRHVVRLEAGQAAFGVAPSVLAGDYCLLAVGTSDTRVLRIKRSRLDEYAANPTYKKDVAGLLDGWVGALSRAMSPSLPPRDSRVLDAGQELAVVPSDTVTSQREIIWLNDVAAPLLFFGSASLPLPADAPYFPVTRHTWVRASEGSELRAIDTSALLASGATWPACDAFTSLILTMLQREAEIRAAGETDRLQRKRAADQKVIHESLARLASILAPEAGAEISGEDADDALFVAATLVGHAQGIAIRQHPDRRRKRDQKNPVGDIARSSRTRVREVTLAGDWWRRDDGPLLAFTSEDLRPVAVVPTSATSYVLIDPIEHTRKPVNREVAATLAGSAFMFYRSFPSRPLSARDLVRFGIVGMRGDLLMLLLMGLAAGALVVLTPVITSIVFDSIIPGGERTRLAEVAGALFVGAIASMLFDLTRGIAVLRLSGRMDADIQSAVWDRLLALPVPFFRQYSTGELSSRAMNVNAIRQTLSGVAVSSVLGVVFSLFNVALLFYYSPPLALIAIVMVLVIVGVTLLLSLKQVRERRPMFEIQGRMSGLVVQLLNGIAKLRVTGAEGRAFAVWATGFTEQRRVAYKARVTGNSQLAFDAIVPVLSTLVIFAVIGLSLSQNFTPGKFLGFNAAFSQFVAAMITMNAAVITLLNVVPMFEQLTPILRAVPEIDLDKSDPGELTGDIEVQHLSFRYKADGPLVLDDVSLHVAPGEFVAIVGPSGSGKSSLLRLLLRFETPESGAVYYDGQDLAGLDVQSVRRQIGVVLQNGQLMTGAIHTNILGSTGGNIEDAWAAAKIAGLDEDINQMPMGMHTVVSQGATTFSGGQRQRLLIARAVVNRPRLLLFDEATSALDSRTQEKVSQSLERMQATRVVIAHRLSTIVNADRIFVLVGGKLVQNGTYHALLNQPGPFADLARRQLA
jgi:NHLM bacteriocin system ABC transporter ATP-binding protein